MIARTRRTPAAVTGGGSQDCIVLGGGCVIHRTTHPELHTLVSRRLHELALKFADHERRIVALEADVAALAAHLESEVTP